MQRLISLRTELTDLAYRLECRGQVDAADVAVVTAARIGELSAELEGKV